MAYGLSGSEGGGVLSAADVRGGGSMEWAAMIGVAPDHPLIGGSGSRAYNVAEDQQNTRIVTTPAGQSGAASHGGLAAVPDGMGGKAVNQLDDWRDLFNFKGSPMPWLCLIALAVLFFAHASIQARAGAFGKKASVGAALG